MEERSEMDKNIDDEMMPGFRFHPTDEEIVDFYLKRKIQQKSLPIELIKQVDIYKYEPWDLPKLASTGEKEWYFYCPRDRKYRNSPRPNRVTRAGFWKATGTDRPIYSSEGKCIGLKKSLVFYRGRAAKGMKTDWMMHEFRLPCLSDSANSKKLSDKSIPARDSWAICRIFKKTNSMSMAQKALSHPWICQLPGTLVSDMITQGGGGSNCNNQFCSENISCTTEIASSSAVQFCGNTNFSDIPSSYRPIINSISTVSKSSSQNPVSNNGDLADNFISSMFSIPDSIGFEEPNQNQYSGFSISEPHHMQQNMATDHNVVEEQGWRKNTCPVQINHQWETTGRSSIGFPFSLPPNDGWNNNKANVASWDSSPPCPTEMSTSYSTNKCYT